MKRLLIFALVLSLVGSAFAAGPAANTNAFKYAEAKLVGGQSVVPYWYGVDTVSVPGSMDTTGHDSIMNTGWIQTNWLPNDAGTYPNYSLSDSMTAYSPNVFDLWVRLDTTSYCSNATGALNGYDKWVQQTGNTKKDSLGFYRIYFEMRMLSTDSVGIWADSTHVVALDGFYTSSLWYGTRQFEDRRRPIASSPDVFKYRVYRLSIPPCLQFRVFIEADKGLCEIVRVPWYVVAAHI